MKYLLCALMVLALLLPGCGSSSASSPAANVPPAPTATLSVSPTAITATEGTLLTWSTTSASTVSIAGIGSVAASGSQLVLPRNTTTFSLTATGTGGTQDATALVTVTKPLPLVNVPAVFIGDSITQFWGGFVNFPADQWTNQGISGEICGDMLARFQTDVIAVHPATVHILCGTNDIIHQAADAATTESNISAMVAQAKAANIQVILGTVTPVRPGLGMNFPTGSNDAITALNVWIRSYATQQQIPIADYNAALSASDGMIVPADTTDGVHPNAAGYAIMTNMVQQLFAE